MERLQDDFGIARGSKCYAFAFKLPAKILVVINLSVVDEDAPAVGCQHRLVCAGRKIENCQALLAERNPTFLPEAPIIGSPMNDRSEHRQDVAGVGGRLVVSPYSGNSAHQGHACNE
jgi:hypothetical protein